MKPGLAMIAAGPSTYFFNYKPARLEALKGEHFDLTCCEGMVGDRLDTEMLLNCRLAASWCGLFAALASIRGSAQTIGVAFPVVLVNTPTLTPTHRKRSHSINYSVHRLLTFHGL